VTTALPDRAVRHVEQVMGMPISVALRGCHAGDARGAAAWAAAMAVLREADRVFSPFRPESAVSRLNRGELDLAHCPPAMAEVLALGEAARHASGGAFDVCRGGVLDPSGVVKGWAAERAAAQFAELPDTDFCLSAGGDITAAPSTPRLRPGASASRTPTTPAVSSRWCRCAPAPSPPRAPPAAARTSSTPAPDARRAASRR
jgi:thiamine biosynthesis lipoprotein